MLYRELYSVRNVNDRIGGKSVNAGEERWFKMKPKLLFTALLLVTVAPSALAAGDERNVSMILRHLPK
jgi:hypothetical protein